MTTLRLILGDQLNPEHSWFQTVDPTVHYTLMELRSETDYVMHHAQKVIAIFAGMRDLARHLKDQGHSVSYIALDDKLNQHDFGKNLKALVKQLSATQVQYQLPDEWRLDAQFKQLESVLGVPVEGVDSEHFITARHEAAELFKGRKQWLMEHFYRTLRQRFDVLMQDKQPIGGVWNFDAENRKPWKGQPPPPADDRATLDHQDIWAVIQAGGVKTFGSPQASAFRWPINRAQALKDLNRFIKDVLPNFGDYEDAMSTKSWRLFHSFLSFALNTKMLNPREVIGAAEKAYKAGKAPLAATEGFIRQILGWREYVRGIYWAQMPGYDEGNALNHQNALPSWFWTGNTKMNCLSHAIGQSLEHAYAHHIQRLMVIGNFSLLAGLNPQAVHQWYLGVYIDAFEWVELPNTVGMSQFADGGLLATKPYVSSGAYIDRMSDYCKGCHYNRKERISADACPFNALYWDFYLRHEDRFAKNPRIGMAYRQLTKMPPEEIASIKQKAQELLSKVDDL